jgi:hypothetical protein
MEVVGIETHEQEGKIVYSLKLGGTILVIYTSHKTKKQVRLI